jgi:hypothetical protein
MKIIKIAKKDHIKKLEEIKETLSDVCEELKKEGVSSDAFSIRLDVCELIHQLSSE